MAEEHQVFVPARAAKLAAGVRRAWESITPYDWTLTEATREVRIPGACSSA